MTAAAAAAISGSSGPKVVLGGGSDGAPGSPPGAPSHRLDALKQERAQLFSRLEWMRAARDELAAPANELQRIEDERQSLELARLYIDPALRATDRHGRRRVYGTPNAGFERYPGQGERPIL
jgi:hypothetical protein